MALFSPFFPLYRNHSSILDALDDHPFLNMNSSFFRENNIARANRANVTETENEYKVEIEVPGYQKPEISIEFGSDGKSLTISGRSEKSHEQDDSSAAKGVSVEEVPDESDKAPAESSEKQEKESTAVTQANEESSVARPAGPKHWISERSVGSFSRTFAFRAGLDHDKATATLENGILTVTIPKAIKVTPKKITIV